MELLRPDPFSGFQNAIMSYVLIQSVALPSGRDGSYSLNTLEAKSVVRPANVTFFLNLTLRQRVGSGVSSSGSSAADTQLTQSLLRDWFRGRLDSRRFVEHVAAARDGGVGFKKNSFQTSSRMPPERCSWFFVRGGPKATSFRTYPGDPSACVAKLDVQEFVRGQQETLGTPRQKR